MIRAVAALAISLTVAMPAKGQRFNLQDATNQFVDAECTVKEWQNDLGLKTPVAATLTIATKYQNATREQRGVAQQIASGARACFAMAGLTVEIVEDAETMPLMGVFVYAIGGYQINVMARLWNVSVGDGVGSSIQHIGAYLTGKDAGAQLLNAIEGFTSFAEYLKPGFIVR